MSSVSTLLASDLYSLHVILRSLRGCKSNIHQAQLGCSLIDLTFTTLPGISNAMLVRDVDKLDPLPDEKLRQLDEEYVVSTTAWGSVLLLTSL
jgi:hypothetical protein